MIHEEHERLYEQVQNPPPGSKMESAKKYGVDLTLNLRRLLLTPTERAREMEGALRFAEQLLEAREKCTRSKRGQSLHKADGVSELPVKG